MKLENKKIKVLIVSGCSFVLMVFFGCFAGMIHDDFVGFFVVSTIIFVFSTRLLFAFEFEEISKLKGYSERKYFWYSFIFGMVGYLVVIALPCKIVVEYDDRKDEK